MHIKQGNSSDPLQLGIELLLKLIDRLQMLQPMFCIIEDSSGDCCIEFMCCITQKLCGWTDCHAHRTVNKTQQLKSWILLIDQIGLYLIGIKFLDITVSFNGENDNYNQIVIVVGNQSFVFHRSPHMWWRLILLDSPQCAFFKISKANDISGLKSAFQCITCVMQL